MSRKITEEEQKKIIELYNQGKLSIDIAKSINRNVSSVCRYIKKQGLPLQNRAGCSIAEQKEIISDYLQGLTIRELNEKYPKYSCSWINLLLRRAKVTRRNGKMPKLNCHYFENIDTEQKAYFLGLLYSDGHIDHTKNGHHFLIAISLIEEDGYIIEEFAKEIQTNLTVKHYTFTEKERVRCMASLVLGSKEMYLDLCTHGMVENKIKNLKHMPVLDEKLIHHFIRGYFDGNGSIFVFHRSKNGTINLGANFCGPYEFLDELNQKLNSVVKAQSKGRKPFNRGNYASLHFGTNNTCSQLFKYMYKDAHIYLKRKYNKFSNFLYCNKKEELK